MQIYVAKNGRQFGPYTKSQLYSYVQSGTFTGADAAWWSNIPGWKTIDDIAFTVDNISSYVDKVDTISNPFPTPKNEKIRKVQIVKPGQLKDLSDLPFSVRVERFFDKHNHKMEFFRTLFGLFTIALQLVILAKLFGYL
jgi:hypothetical protein